MLREFVKGLAGLGIMATGVEALALEPDHIAAHRHSSHHRQEVLSSQICGCFHCLSIYTPDEIWNDGWIDEDISGIGQTARCPVCGIDSVIGSKSSYSITKSFLAKMERHWFGMRTYDDLGNPGRLAVVRLKKGL